MSHSENIHTNNASDDGVVVSVFLNGTCSNIRDSNKVPGFNNPYYPNGETISVLRTNIAGDDLVDELLTDLIAINETTVSAKELEELLNETATEALTWKNRKAYVLYGDRLFYVDRNSKIINELHSEDDTNSLAKKIKTALSIKEINFKENEKSQCIIERIQSKELLRLIDAINHHPLIHCNAKEFFIGVDGPGSGNLDHHKRLVHAGNHSDSDQVLWGDGIEENINHVIESLKLFIASGRKIKTLNLTGWSRGAAACIKLATRMYNTPELAHIDVNIFGIDPVPGFTKADIENTTLTPNVKNAIFVYPEHEWSAGFTPVKPKVMSEATNVWHYVYPGHHGTLSGNHGWRFAETAKLFSNLKLALKEPSIIIRWMQEQFLTQHGTTLKEKLVKENNQPYEAEDLLELFDQMNEDLGKSCSLVLSSVEPTKENIGTLQAKTAYVMFDNKLFYINKHRNEIISLCNDVSRIESLLKSIKVEKQALTEGESFKCLVETLSEVQLSSFTAFTKHSANVYQLLALHESYTVQQKQGSSRKITDGNENWTNLTYSNIPEFKKERHREDGAVNSFHAYLRDIVNRQNSSTNNNNNQHQRLDNGVNMLQQFMQKPSVNTFEMDEFLNSKIDDKDKVDDAIGNSNLSGSQLSINSDGVNIDNTQILSHINQQEAKELTKEQLLEINEKFTAALMSNSDPHENTNNNANHCPPSEEVIDLTASQAEILKELEERVAQLAAEQKHQEEKSRAQDAKREKETQIELKVSAESPGVKAALRHVFKTQEQAAIAAYRAREEKLRQIEEEMLKQQTNSSVHDPSAFVEKGENGKTPAELALLQAEKMTREALMKLQMLQNVSEGSDIETDTELTESSDSREILQPEQPTDDEKQDNPLSQIKLDITQEDTDATIEFLRKFEEEIPDVEEEIPQEALREYLNQLQNILKQNDSSSSDEMQTATHSDASNNNNQQTELEQKEEEWEKREQLHAEQAEVWKREQQLKQLVAQRQCEQEETKRKITAQIADEIVNELMNKQLGIKPKQDKTDLDLTQVSPEGSDVETDAELADDAEEIKTEPHVPQSDAPDASLSGSEHDEPQARQVVDYVPASEPQTNIKEIDHSRENDLKRMQELSERERTLIKEIDILNEEISDTKIKPNFKNNVASLKRAQPHFDIYTPPSVPVLPQPLVVAEPKKNKFPWMILAMVLGAIVVTSIVLPLAILLWPATLATIGGALIGWLVVATTSAKLGVGITAIALGSTATGSGIGALFKLCITAIQNKFNVGKKSEPILPEIDVPPVKEPEPVKEDKARIVFKPSTRPEEALIQQKEEELGKVRSELQELKLKYPTISDSSFGLMSKDQSQAKPDFTVNNNNNNLSP